MSLTPQQAAQRLLLITKTRDSFHGFVQALYPDFKLAGFQEELIETLDQLEKDTLGSNRLLITMPPRHGKSWLASTLFPVYYLARKANRNVLATSYNQDLAKPSTIGALHWAAATTPLAWVARPLVALQPCS
jgi:hypothetical protein